MHLNAIFAAIAVAVSLSGKPPMTYTAVTNEIKEYNSYFTTAYTEAYVDYGYEDTITKETVIDETAGTQGAGITTYKNISGDIVRIHFWFMGERGQAEENIYVLSNYYYVTTLTRFYSSYSFAADGGGDFLTTEFAEYIVYEDRTYLIDRISKKLLPTAEDVISEYEWGYFEK
jgi:hypothetical protein